MDERKDTNEFKVSKQVNTVATTAVKVGVETLLTAARFQVYLQFLIDCLSEDEDRCSEAGDFFDEDGHLVLLDGAGAVLVELFEALLEVSLAEFTGVVHFGEGVLDELLGFFLVEGAGIVLVVFSPDVVNTLSNNSVDVSHFSIFFGI